MKRYLAAVLVMVAFPTAAAYAGVDVNLNIGTPPVVVAPPPVRYYPAPAPEPVVEVAPSFIYAPDLGCYVAVDVPYEMVYAGGSYYLYRGGYWYRGASYGGPWVYASPRRLPVVLRQYRYDQIRSYRDREYRVFAADREHYHGRWHRPVGERRGHDHFERREHGGERGRDRW